ncbi:MAG: DUF4054 domain-containing protein [Planctomycetaceae bacterium]|jgi:hypothetical protein|nr:DUF4054 domain-containing protein [Planctomycetaceae bacterium]
MPPFYTTSEQVRKIDPSILPEEDLTPYIDTAHALVYNSIVQCKCGVGYTDELLALIEAWLAAHFHQVQTGIITSESAGSASQSTSISQDTFLLNTMFGQQAMLLDYNNCLAALLGDIENAKSGKTRKRVGFHWLGDKTPRYGQDIY